MQVNDQQRQLQDLVSVDVLDWNYQAGQSTVSLVAIQLNDNYLLIPRCTDFSYAIQEVSSARTQENLGSQWETGRFGRLTVKLEGAAFELAVSLLLSYHHLHSIHRVPRVVHQRSVYGLCGSLPSSVCISASRRKPLPIELIGVVIAISATFSAGQSSRHK